MRTGLLGCVLLALAACGVAETRQGPDATAEVPGEAAANVTVENPAYSFTSPSRDGIGKWYMGREISHVMGHLGAGWLERPEREQVERTDLLIDNLPLQPDSVVADIGAGTGYFSFPVARRLPQGQVLAVDIQQEMLDIIRQRAQEMKVDNVEPILGSISNPGLTPDSVDLIFIVDAYHEFSHPMEMGQEMVAALRPGGQLVLIEYRGEDASVPIKRLHKMTQAQARAEMAALGLRWVRTEDFLPQQHFLVFAK